MLQEKDYYPIRLEKIKGVVKPRGFVPAKLMYSTKEGIDAFDSVARAGSKYWLSWDSALCIGQNAEYLSEHLKDYSIIELGGFDGSAMNDVFKDGNARGYKYDYINIDLGKNLKDLMNRNFTDLNNVNYSLMPNDFDNLEFIKDIKTEKSKAVLFLGNTFGNYNIKYGNTWLRKLYNSMKIGDIFVLGFDKRMSAKKHLECYNVPENGHMTMLASQQFGLPISNLSPGSIFDDEGIHGGVFVTNSFIFGGKKYLTDDFIEVFVSLKQTLKLIKSRVQGAGFRVTKVLKSKEGHIHHLILKKS